MIGKVIERYDLLDSTNNHIKRNIEEIEHGTIIHAFQQSKGRGRFGNNWVSPKGNLYFSFVLKEEADRLNLFHLIMKTSIAILQTLKNIGIIGNIKYPNDILVNQKKIAGVLIESVGYEKIETIIIGIGINVNQRNFDEFDTLPTSIILETNHEESIENLLDEFISRYNSLNDRFDIYEIYQKSLLFIEKTVHYKEKNCKILGVSDKGELIIEYEKSPIYLNYSEKPFRSNINRN